MADQDRVLGWDLLRGLCALAVAGYHLLSWQGLAHWHVFGTYGVYLFFVLSGASLAYTYAPSIRDRSFSFRSFLMVRYFRLAPLYLLLLMLVLPWKFFNDGLSSALLWKLALNASFLFGFYQPVTHSLLVGGWSLGIEVVFYLLFPLLMASFRHWVLAAGLMLVLLLVQFFWIAFTLGAETGYQANQVRYHHAPAFAAYFMGGCILGWLRRFQTEPRRLGQTTGLLLLGLGFCLLGLFNPDQAGDQLTGWRGLFLFALCFALVGIATKLRLTGKMVGVAKFSGDVTYGLYLIHPVIFFGLAFVVLPRLGSTVLNDGSVTEKWACALAIIVVSCVLAWLSEYFYERPLRSWSKKTSLQQTAGHCVGSH